MVLLSRKKKIPGNNGGLTEIEVMLVCALQSDVRTNVQLQNSFNMNYCCFQLASRDAHLSVFTL